MRCYGIRTNVNNNYEKVRFTGLFDRAEIVQAIEIADIATGGPYLEPGTGTGDLRKAVRDYLRTSPYAKTSRPGEQSEGGDGVTVVEIK